MKATLQAVPHPNPLAHILRCDDWTKVKIQPTTTCNYKQWRTVSARGVKILPSPIRAVELALPVFRVGLESPGHAFVVRLGSFFACEQSGGQERLLVGTRDKAWNMKLNSELGKLKP